jgi:hypothetical protein
MIRPLIIRIIGGVIISTSLYYIIWFSRLGRDISVLFPIITFYILTFIIGIGLVYLKNWARQMAAAFLGIYAVISIMQVVISWHISPPHVFCGDINQFEEARKSVVLLRCIEGIVSIIFMFILILYGYRGGSKGGIRVQKIR